MDEFVDRFLRGAGGRQEIVVDGEVVGAVHETNQGFLAIPVGLGEGHGGIEAAGATAAEAASALAALLEEILDDFRFDITALPEPELGATHIVLVIAHGSGRVLERHITDDPYGLVEAAREAQAIPYEERLEMQLQRELREAGRA